jgi:uncharacterized membrane protein/predicted DsbA family dithiol-disulfide isomerase
MTSRSRIIILSLALIGLAVSSDATWIHHKLLTDASFTPPCDVNAKFNCSEVYRSAYGSVRGVPVALGGVVWFGLVALIAGFAKPSKAGDKNNAAGAYLFALSTIGLAVVLSLAYTSFAVLHTYCLLCLATYACVIGIFITTGLTASTPMTSLPGRFLSDLRGLVKKPLPLMITVLFLLATGTLMGALQAENNGSAPMMTSAPPPRLPNASPAANGGTQEPEDPKAAFEAWWNAQPRIETGVPLNGAKVVIVKFSDFQCPGCKQTWIMYSPILKKYTDAGSQVRFVMKDFPLNSNCNVAVQTQMHPFSCQASVAYRAAVERGKGPEMENWIFTNQTILTNENIREAAKDIAGITDLDREMPLRLPSIKKDTADGGALQINQTPTFFINGVKLPTESWLNPEYFDLAIQIELKKAGVTPAKAGGE